MTFVSAITVNPFVIGNMKMSIGTYTNGAGDSGGDVDTGLSYCDQLVLQPGGTSVQASASVINESLPVAGNAITIVTSLGEDGVWMAIGR